MKKKNLYYAAVLQRSSFLLSVLRFFFGICSIPRSFIENFTRKNFGRRYYSFSLCGFTAIVLAFLPLAWSVNSSGVLNFISLHLTWYVYLTAYVVYAWKRYKEGDRTFGSYDFTQFSKYAGDIHPMLNDIKIAGEKQTRRTLATIYEPGVFLGIGIVMVFFHQPIGLLLIFSAIIYSLSWLGQYYIGDQFVLDKIDEMICNEELVNSFVNDLPPNETRGFESYCSRPGNPEFRRKVVDTMFEEEPAVEVL